jgi:ribosomal protein L37AE/L43A
MFEIIMACVMGLLLVAGVVIVLLEHIRCPYCGSMNIRHDKTGVGFCRRCRRFIV